MVPWFAVALHAQVIRPQDGAVMTLTAHHPTDPRQVLLSQSDGTLAWWAVDPAALALVRLPDLAEALSTIWHHLSPYTILEVST
jgi:hypothetical protein